MMTIKAIPMNQHVRNQLSLLAWLFAAACAWLLFMSAAAAAQHAADPQHDVVIVSTSAPAIAATATVK